jgi:hypothetical protein
MASMSVHIVHTYGGEFEVTFRKRTVRKYNIDFHCNVTYHTTFIMFLNEATHDFDAPRVAQWEDEESEGAVINESESSRLVCGILILKWAL